MSQSYIHLFHLLLLQATMSVMCTLTATVLFPYVFFTRKGGVLKELHSTHTLFPADFHLHRIMAAESRPEITPISLICHVLVFRCRLGTVNLSF